MVLRTRALLLSWVGRRPVQVVVAWDPDTDERYVITAYEPESGLWSEDFKGLRQP